jgi:hypothetical protein
MPHPAAALPQHRRERRPRGAQRRHQPGGHAARHRQREGEEYHHAVHPRVAEARHAVRAPRDEEPDADVREPQAEPRAGERDGQALGEHLADDAPAAGA